MKTLADGRAVEELRERLRAVGPESVRHWGAMSAGEMVCHVRDAFRMAMGEVPAGADRRGLPPRVIKALALWMPMQWPHSVPTIAELRRGVAVVPDSFAGDHAGLMAAFERFVVMRENRTAHPIFGVMRPRDWMRWGYLHTDHHLRQFGC